MTGEQKLIAIIFSAFFISMGVATIGDSVSKVFTEKYADTHCSSGLTKK